MFEYLYSNFDMPGFFRLFSYVSFRAIAACLFAMVFSLAFGEVFIRYLQKFNLKEIIRSDGPNSHKAKQGTPTMGGLLILASIAFACLLFGNFSNIYFLLLLIFIFLFALIGFIDDYIKVILKNKQGLNSKVKFILTVIVSLSFCLLYYYISPNQNTNYHLISYELSSIFIPFFKNPVILLPLSLSLIFWIIVIVGSSHAVNLSDGLDGLAIGNLSIATSTIAVFAYLTGTPLAANYLNLPLIEGAHEISVFLAAITGAGIGFLWFNASPAKIFMGDTGSIALGSALGMVAIIIKKEILLVLICGVFVIEALSVIIQVTSYKLRRKRVFKMSPIHHHFELTGWPETRVVIRFWLIGIVLALLAISTLKIQ